MFFRISLYVALIIFGIGLGYKVLRWFQCRIGDQGKEITAWERFFQALKGVVSTILSLKFFALIKIGVLDIFFQRRIGREGLTRWLMHFFIAYGFLFLLLMHALDRYVSQKLFTEYVSTLNPFLFLRNLFGAMMLVGLGMAAYRRIFNRTMRLTTRGVDIYALVVLALIGISGFFLEATKIVSHQRYEEMVTEFSSISGEEEAAPLRAYWAKEFGVVFPKTPSLDAAMVQKGQEVHTLNCASCHSKPRAAFVSYGVAKAISPAALIVGQAGVRSFLRYFHFLVCFIGLALLPFTKFFHILISPLMLLIDGVMDWTKASPTMVATVRAIELDACTHCATCSLHCSVAPIYQAIPNTTLLPSEKLRVLTLLGSRKEKMSPSLPVIAEGEYMCTKCTRCTTVCPVGINLQDFWLSLDKTLLDQGCPELFTRTRDAVVEKFDWERKKTVIELPPPGKKFIQSVGLSFQASTFNSCFTCMTCTNACPVVTNYKDPLEKFGLLPHLIMQSLKYGLQDNVLGARMVWDCLGCYNCQECCPQGVRVTDILFEIKNLAFQQEKSLTSREGA